MMNGPEQAVSVAERHPITVDSEVVSLTVATDLRSGALSDQDKASLRNFVSGFKTRGHGALNVSTPSYGGGRSAQKTSTRVVRLIDEAGVPKSRIASASYAPTDGQTGAPIIISYVQYVASAGACGDWSDDLATSWSNAATPNFGCSTQNNIAAMLIDPHDLLAPRGMAPADANRRSTVLEQYRKGADTAAERSEQESGQVSEIE
jgi:pilus assembly protein CpaD